MTGYTVHTGTTIKFAGGWDRIFSGKKPAKGRVAQGKSVAKKPVTKVRKPKKSTRPAAKKGRRTK